MSSFKCRFIWNNEQLGICFTAVLLHFFELCLDSPGNLEDVTSHDASNIAKPQVQRNQMLVQNWSVKVSKRPTRTSRTSSYLRCMMFAIDKASYFMLELPMSCVELFWTTSRLDMHSPHHRKRHIMGPIVCTNKYWSMLLHIAPYCSYGANNRSDKLFSKTRTNVDKIASYTVNSHLHRGPAGSWHANQWALRNRWRFGPKETAQMIPNDCEITVQKSVARPFD